MPAAPRIGKWVRSRPRRNSRIVDAIQFGCRFATNDLRPRVIQVREAIVYREDGVVVGRQSDVECHKQKRSSDRVQIPQRPGNDATLDGTKLRAASFTRE